MASNQLYKQLSPYKIFKIEGATSTGTAFQRTEGRKGVKLEKKRLSQKVSLLFFYSDPYRKHSIVYAILRVLFSIFWAFDTASF